MTSKVPPALTVLVPQEPGSLDRTLVASSHDDPLLLLVRAAAGGAREPLIRLLSLVAPAVAATVRVFLGRDHGDHEDVVQDVLIAVSASLPRFRGDSSFLHYCRRIAVRTTLAHRRRLRARAEGTLQVSPPELAHAAPDAGLERAQRLLAFRRLLDQLPEGQAESLAYRVILECPLPVIARETGVPINTVRSRIRLARDHLRELISADPALRQLLRDIP